MYTLKVSYTLHHEIMTGRIDRDIIEAAISGYESRVAGFQQRIDELRSMLHGEPEARSEKTAPASEAPISTNGATRRMSASAKRKLSLAAKKRWAQLKRRHPNAKTLAG